MLFVGAAGLATFSFLARTRKIRVIPRIADAEFLELYRLSFKDPDDLILRQRGLIARHLRLPAEVLSPNQSLQELSRYCGFVGEYETGIGDLEEELLDLFEKAQIRREQAFPRSVGELIHEFIIATEALSAAYQS